MPEEALFSTFSVSEAEPNWTEPGFSLWLVTIIW